MTSLRAVLIVLVLGGLGLVGGLVLLVADDESRIGSFRSHCAESGGHIYKPGSTSWCLSEGRIVEVYP